MIDSATFKREQGNLMEMSYFVRFPLFASLTPAAAILWMNSTPAFWRRLSRSANVGW
jgi:hypothetical protein